MQQVSNVFNSVFGYVVPPIAPVLSDPALKQARCDLSLEDMGVSVDDLKATATLTPVLNEEVQNISEESIRKSNPHFDFSAESIIKVKGARIRLPDQIERYKVQIAIWESQLKDYNALLPSIKLMSMLRNKGLERRSLTSLSYTPSPPPAQSHRGAAVSVNKRRCLDLEYTDANSAGVSLLNNLDSFSDNDNENVAPEQLPNYADNNFYTYNNNSKNNNDYSHNNSNNTHCHNNNLNNNNHSYNHHSNSHYNSNIHSISNNNNSQCHDNNNNNNLNRGSPSPPIYPLIGDSKSY